MPRGIPNAKRDDTGMRYTTFSVPLASVCGQKYLACPLNVTNSIYRPNPKHVGTTYLKSETQTIWARNALRKSKAPAENIGVPQEQRLGFNTFIISYET
jgi:actin-related protein 8